MYNIYIPTLWNTACILHLCHILIPTGHISSTQKPTWLVAILFNTGALEHQIKSQKMTDLIQFSDGKFSY